MASPPTQKLLENVTDAKIDIKQGDTIQEVPRDTKRRSPSSAKRPSKRSGGSISAPKTRKKRALRSKLFTRHIRRRTRSISKKPSLPTISLFTTRAERRSRIHHTSIAHQKSDTLGIRIKRGGRVISVVEAHIWLAIAFICFLSAVIRTMEPALAVEVDKLCWGIVFCEWRATWEERLGCYLMMG
jgi:hypothetical protein